MLFQFFSISLYKSLSARLPLIFMVLANARMAQASMNTYAQAEKSVTNHGQANAGAEQQNVCSSRAAIPRQLR